MIVFYDPVPISQNPDRFRITWTATGDKDDLTAGKTNWIEVAETEIAALDAWAVEGGALVLVTLDPYRRAAIARINTAAGAKRLEFITDIPGQQMLYQAKEQEAAAYLAESPEPATLANYPLIAAEVGPGLTAATPLALAQLWLTLAAQWRQVAGYIETGRLWSIYAIEQAPDLAAIETVEATFAAGLAQIQLP